MKNKLYDPNKYSKDDGNAFMHMILGNLPRLNIYKLNVSCAFYVMFFWFEASYWPLCSLKLRTTKKRKTYEESVL